MEVVEFACGIPQLLKGEYSEQVGTGVDSYSMRQPLGVCAGITPFNFPAMVPMWMFPVAIACGNTFVLKPSERDPSASLLHRRAAQGGRAARRRVQRRAGRQGRGRRAAHASAASAPSASSARRRSPKYIYETGAAHGKRVQALGGAKNHMVVMPDADLDQAVDALIGAAYGSAGERCMAISVAVAVGGAADPLVERLAERVPKHQGRPRHGRRAPRWGRWSRARTARRSSGYVDTGVAEGAKLVVDGRGLKVRGPRERLLPRRLPVRRRQARHADLQRGDLRAGARRRARRRTSTKRSR